MDCLAGFCIVRRWNNMLNRRSLIHVAQLISLVLLPTAFAPTSLAAEADAQQPPRLVLQLTIDQLRGDMLLRYRTRFGSNGFRRLTDGGVYFTNAFYGAGNTFTASGHAVLVTGADTAEHGMVANEWFDRDSGRVMYATFDARYGASPLNLTSTTIGDELVSTAPDGARAFAVAGKDRSAIIPGGHLGKAYWFSDLDGSFTTSSYYGTPPAWLQAWGKSAIEKYRGREWALPRARSSYIHVHNAANAYARPHAGTTFPHTVSGPDTKKFIAAFRATPYLDEYTLDFARALIRSERVGQDAVTDYLSISLSGTDYIGHAYGPDSLEYEDNLLWLDAALAAFLADLDRVIGANRFLIVLSADHGVDDIPELRRAEGYDAGRIYPRPMLEHLNATLRARFNTGDDLVRAFVTPGFYLDDAAIGQLARSTGNDRIRGVVEEALAEELRKLAGIAYACTRTALLAGMVPDTELGRRVARSVHPTRSGDVVVVQKQFWYLYNDPECCAAMHGSPYSYDTYVPVVFYGPGIAARVVSRPIEPASIAPTLAALLNIEPPSGNSAPALPEVLEARH